MFRACIRLKLSIFEYDLLKPNFWGDSSMVLHLACCLMGEQKL